MPTNPLWIEHTEKAAWDSVQALRIELEQERQKLERLERLQPSWSRLAGLIEEARREHAIETDDPAEVFERLAGALRDSEERNRALKLELERRERELELGRFNASTRNQSVIAAPRRLSPPVRWFARLLERRLAAARETAQTPPSTPARIAAALEIKLDELSGARKEELLELAVAIGELALALGRSARRSARDSRD